MKTICRHVEVEKPHSALAVPVWYCLDDDTRREIRRRWGRWLKQPAHVPLVVSLPNPQVESLAEIDRLMRENKEVARI